jgi:hypothetical protein
MAISQIKRTIMTIVFIGTLDHFVGVGGAESTIGLFLGLL